MEHDMKFKTIPFIWKLRKRWAIKKLILTMHWKLWRSSKIKDPTIRFLYVLQLTAVIVSQCKLIAATPRPK
jgi:hypothetical protein